MDVIIDGYNLIANEQGLRGALEHKRIALVQQLARYGQAKGFRISVVFDGWKAGRLDESRERVDGVTVIYSRQGEKADSVVVRLARQRGSGCVVVSSDREVRVAVEKFGATAIYAAEFHDILRRMDAPATYEQNYEAGTAQQRAGKRMAKAERRRQEKLKKMRLE
jgi:predicted RNA-binding protein with PIN domain